MMLLLACPQCKQKMKYQARGTGVGGKRKSCVYCGKSFDVLKQRISLK